MSYPAAKTWQVSKQTPTRRLFVDPVDDRGDLLERPSERRPLSRRRLQQQHAPPVRSLVVDAIDRVGHPRDPRLRTAPEMTTRVRDEVGHVELIAPIKFLWQRQP